MIPDIVRLPQPPADPAPDTRTFIVASAPPVVLHDAIPETARHQLIDHWRAGDLLSREHVQDAERVAAPASSLPAVVYMLTQVAEHFGLPYLQSTTRAAVARYGPGCFRDWHVDGAPHTVAFSVLLNDDFAGGDIEIHPSGTVALAPGDAVGFTSRTQHRVWPVGHGERFVLLGFGGYDR